MRLCSLLAGKRKPRPGLGVGPFSPKQPAARQRRWRRAHFGTTGPKPHPSRFKNLYSQPSDAVRPGLFPPCRVKKPCNTPSIAAVFCLAGRENPLSCLHHPAVNTGSNKPLHPPPYRRTFAKSRLRWPFPAKFPLYRQPGVCYNCKQSDVPRPPPGHRRQFPPGSP